MLHKLKRMFGMENEQITIAREWFQEHYDADLTGIKRFYIERGSTLRVKLADPIDLDVMAEVIRESADEDKYEIEVDRDARPPTVNVYKIMIDDGERFGKHLHTHFNQTNAPYLQTTHLREGDEMNERYHILSKYLQCRYKDD